MAILIFASNLNAQSKTDSAEILLKTKTVITQKLAKQMAELAEQEAIKNKWNVCIAVVDEAGQLIHFMRMDESMPASIDVSIAKAKAAALFKRDTKVLQDRLKEGNNGILKLPNAIATEGGIVLTYQGKIIGAIGVSGASSAEDAQVARAGAVLLANLK